jgi:hypothetical protein
MLSALRISVLGQPEGGKVQTVSIVKNKAAHSKDKPPGVSYYTFETSAKQVYVRIIDAIIVYRSAQI